MFIIDINNKESIVCYTREEIEKIIKNLVNYKVIYWNSQNHKGYILTEYNK